MTNKTPMPNTMPLMQLGIAASATPNAIAASQITKTITIMAMMSWGIDVRVHGFLPTYTLPVPLQLGQTIKPVLPQ
jgi:hypothetical protein